MTVCLCLGIACWVVALFFALRWRKDGSAVIRALGVGVFGSLFFFIYPYARAQSGVLAIPFGLLQVMASAVVASDPLAIFELLNAEYDAPYLGAYKTILIILHVIAPLFTIGITLSFFKSKFAALLYRVRAAFRSSHIFSEINERTLCLAESIYASNKKSVFVFLGDAEQLEALRELAERVRAVGGYVLDVAPAEVRHSLRKTRTYYLLGTDSGRNLKDALRLFEKYDKIGGERIKIWLYSKDEAASVVFDNLDEKIDIRLINEERLIAMGLMQSYPLYDGIKEGKFVFLLLGAGNIGLEILRTALWCACFGEEISTEFHVLDLNAEQAAQKLKKTSPDLLEGYPVVFHNANVESATFIELLKSIRPTYIVTALGQERRNISASMDIRRAYGFDGKFPLIHVLIDRADSALVLDGMRLSDWRFSKEKKAFERKELCSFGLLPFGSYAETYSSIRFSNGYYDGLAMAINAVRCGITTMEGAQDVEVLRDLLNKVEFYKSFSYAYATAIPYKLWLMGLTFVQDGKGEVFALEEALPRYEEKLMAQEEQRWICYMRCMGWTEMPLDEVAGASYQDKLRRRHARLNPANIERLSEIVGRDFAKENREDLYRLPAIIRLANCLIDTPYSIRKREE